MSKQIEVEIRGIIDDAAYDKLKNFLDSHGVHKASTEREMFLLQDYPGFSREFVGRQVDIRLRNTNGECEVMLKQNMGNGREEVSLGLKDNNLETAKKIFRAFGCKKAIWMHRLKEVYEYKNIEWSLVIAPNNIRYYEAELALENESEIETAREKLIAEAKSLGLDVLDDAQTQAFVERLDREANKLVDL